MNVFIAREVLLCRYWTRSERRKPQEESGDGRLQFHCVHTLTFASAGGEGSEDPFPTICPDAAIPFNGRCAGLTPEEVNSCPVGIE